MSDEPPLFGGNDAPDPKNPTEVFERYDLTGSHIRNWTTRARDRLTATLRRLFSFGKRVSNTTLPGSSNTIADKMIQAPGKGIEFLEARLDQTPIENQLKSAQTETEYLKQELLRHQIAKTEAETKGQRLDNTVKELEIQARIQELIKGKTNVYVVNDDHGTTIVFGNIVQDAVIENKTESETPNQD